MNIVPADSTANQQMTIRYGDDTLQLTIMWKSIGSHWYMDVLDVETGAYVVQYLPLEVGIPLGQRLGEAWVFMLIDTSSAQLDPMRVEDLGARCLLLIGTLDEARSLFGLLQ